MTKEYHGKRKRSDDEKRSRKRRRAKKKGFIDAAVERGLYIWSSSIWCVNWTPHF